MGFNKMSSEELRLAKLWYDEDGKTPLEISQLLRRDKSTITRHVVKRTLKQRDGRAPVTVSDSDDDASRATPMGNIMNGQLLYEHEASEKV